MKFSKNFTDRDTGAMNSESPDFLQKAIILLVPAKAGDRMLPACLCREASATSPDFF